MAAINQGGTFYRLDESSQSGDCGEANVMALHLASKQVMPFAFAVKGIREFCIECMGGRGTGQNSSKLIAERSSPDCSLYDFRFGKNPFHTQNLSEEERMQRAKLARERFSKREALLN